MLAIFNFNEKDVTIWLLQNRWIINIFRLSVNTAERVKCICGNQWENRKFIFTWKKMSQVQYVSLLVCWSLLCHKLKKKIVLRKTFRLLQRVSEGKPLENNWLVAVSRWKWFQRYLSNKSAGLIATVYKSFSLIISFQGKFQYQLSVENSGNLVGNVPVGDRVLSSYEQKSQLPHLIETA